MDDCTKFLVRLSGANAATKQYIIKLLLSAAQTIGQTVKRHIDSLILEAIDYNKQHAASTSSSKAAGMPSVDSASELESMDEPQASTSSAVVSRGILPNRCTLIMSSV